MKWEVDYIDAYACGSLHNNKNARYHVDIIDFRALIMHYRLKKKSESIKFAQR